MKFESRRPCVLICDPIAEVGLEMLREQADVDVKTGLSPADLSAAIGKYEAIVVGRTTKVTAEVIENAHRYLRRPRKWFLYGQLYCTQYAGLHRGSYHRVGRRWQHDLHPPR